MIPNDERDRLVDVFLAELVGGQAPPDLTERVLEGAMAGPRRKIGWWRPALAAAAAVIVAIGAWAIFAHRYPSPTATGDYRVIEGGEVKRGSLIGTDAGRAALAMGGYVRVDMDPQSRVRLQGQKRAEAVDLEKGSATFEVDGHIGTFAVRTEVGTVSVTGTRFTVRILETQGATMSPRQMAVKVLVGAVMVSGAWGSTTVLAGDEQVVGRTGPVAAATTQRVTLAGIGKAIGDPKAKMDPAVANATLTVTADDGTVTVYDVYGWGGIIIAKNADGKKVEVTGVVGEKNGKKTITAASVGVKIIVVE